MEFKGLFDLQLMMFLLMGTGMFLRKKNIITKEGRGVLTDLIINVLLPCNIITAFSIPFDRSLLVSGFQILMVSLFLQLFCAAVSAFCYQKLPKKQRMILQYGTVCSNAGFLGNPVAEGLYGSLGLLYASIYLIPQRIVMWSAGVSYFTESPDKKEVLKKVLRHPCIIAVEIGILLMAAQYRLPPVSKQGCKQPGRLHDCHYHAFYWFRSGRRGDPSYGLKAYSKLLPDPPAFYPISRSCGLSYVFH